VIVNLDGIEELINRADLAPAVIRRAKKSALGSVGYHLIHELKKQITSKGSYASGMWKKQHPLTRLSKRRTGRSARLNIGRNKPLGGLKRFTRYRVSKDAVQVLFARKKKGPIGTFDKLMNDFIQRSEFGETQTLTPKSKRFRAARGFAVRKSTTAIRIPPRQTINPIYRKNKDLLLGIFETKFNASVERQLNE